MAASDTSFNVGRDCQLVLIGPFGRIDFKHVTNFTVKQVVDKVRVKPLNGPRLARDLPGGWDGTFVIERANSAADDLASVIETAFWSGAAIPPGVLFQNVNEVDGSVSTYQHDGVTVNLSDGGSYQQEQSVKQTVEWSAARRRRI
jgi:hypothetical protein